MIARRPLIGGAERQDQFRARVLMPNLGRIDMVPMADLACGQKEIDARPRRAVGHAAAHPCLAIMPPFGMGHQAQMGDNLGGCIHALAQDGCARIARDIAQFFLDTDQLVVFRQTI